MEIKTVEDLLTASPRGWGWGKGKKTRASSEMSSVSSPHPPTGGQVKEIVGGRSDGGMTFQTNSRSTLALARSLR